MIDFIACINKRFELERQIEAIDETLNTRAREIARLKNTILNETFDLSAHIQEDPIIDLEKRTITFTLITHAHCSCCDDDYDQMTVSFDELLDEWLADTYRKQRAKQDTAQELARKERERRAAEQREAQDRSTYERLRKKYEKDVT